MIIVNFKIYEQSFGEKAIRLAEVCETVKKKSKVEIVAAVSALDAYRIKQKFDLKVILQHADHFKDGAHSGFISPFQAKELEIDGSILNHSEHRIEAGSIKSILSDWPSEFMSVVCIQTLGQMEKWGRKIKADYLAYEPKELIGSKDKSVASEKSEQIKKMAELSAIPLLVGAGIHNKKDVQISLAMGAKGILVASDVVKAENPEKELLELASAF